MDFNSVDGDVALPQSSCYIGDFRKYFQVLCTVSSQWGKQTKN